MTQRVSGGIWPVHVRIADSLIRSAQMAFASADEQDTSSTGLVESSPRGSVAKRRSINSDHPRSHEPRTSFGWIVTQRSGQRLYQGVHGRRPPFEEGLAVTEQDHLEAELGHLADRVLGRGHVLAEPGVGPSDSRVGA